MYVYFVQMHSILNANSHPHNSSDSFALKANLLYLYIFPASFISTLFSLCLLEACLAYWRKGLPGATGAEGSVLYSSLTVLLVTGARPNTHLSQYQSGEEKNSYSQIDLLKDAIVFTIKS